MHFKFYELFISGIFYLIFSGLCWPQVIETMESKTVDSGGLLYSGQIVKKSTKIITTMLG